MKEKLEHKLTNRINEVFNSHDPDFNPQDWEKMKTMLEGDLVPFKLYFINYLKVAAIVLLLAVDGFFLWKMNNNPSQEMGEKVQTIANQEEQPDIKELAPQNLAQEDNFKAGPESVSKQNINDEPQIHHTSELYQNPKQGKLIEKKDNSLVQEILGAPDIKQSPEAIQIVVSDLFTDFNPEIEIRFRQDELYLANVSNSSNSKSSDEKMPAIYPSDSRKPRSSLGVEVASFTQYSPDDLNPGLGIGAGFAANIPVFKGLAFAPGLTINRQNLAYNDQNTLEEATSYTTTNSYDIQNFLSDNPEISPTEVSLTALDIPLNLQYRFIERKKTNYFVEFGVSSLLYISESYTYEFPNDVSGGYDVGAFQTFDFASLLNFSAGMGYRLGTRFDIVVNPYLKYPVSNLSDAELKFGNGGIKMKFMIFPKN
ncbi:MAG: PorT family protein [Bacteroidales bacterium]|nr:PorT family protein [Bacteroidales bacterium]